MTDQAPFQAPLQAPPSFVTAAMYAWLLVLRQDMKLGKFKLQGLQHRNATCRAPVVACGGPVVSLTTFGDRLNTVYLTLESIGIGSRLPSRLILWIQDEQSFEQRPATLRRLEDRGLEVRLTESYRSHSKYFPYLEQATSFDLPLVTADDDVFYARWWLEGLDEAYRREPDLIHCYRAHVMQFEGDLLKPYLHWKQCRSTLPNARCFATGVAGSIYPPKFLASLKRAGDRFMEVCPKADDIWLHVNALRAGFPIRQIGARPVDFPAIPGTQQNGLFQVNWNVGGNDEQIRRTYTEDDLAKLVAARQI